MPYLYTSRVPHLRDGLIVAKVGHFRGSENPDTLNSPIASGLKSGSHELRSWGEGRREPLH
jgi:hypothetical protein